MLVCVFMYLIHLIQNFLKPNDSVQLYKKLKDFRKNGQDIGRVFHFYFWNICLKYILLVKFSARYSDEYRQAFYVNFNLRLL
jgi:hypothetical protein